MCKEFIRIIMTEKYYAIEESKESRWNKFSFDRYKCIFIHIPKTGGISISESLFGNYGLSHMTAKEAYEIYKPISFYRYFKFSVVRNPWDRLFSAYTFLKSGGMNQVDSDWANTHLVEINDFESFIKDWLNPNRIYSEIHFKPQFEFLLNNNNIIKIDYIGRYESFTQSFQKIKIRVYSNATLLH